MLKLIFPFMLGIFIGVYYPIDNKVVIFAGLAVFLLALYYLAFLRLKRTWWYAIVFNLCFAFVGYSIVSVHYMQRGPADFSNYSPEKYTWAEVVLQDMPTQSEKTVKTKADVLKIQDSTGWHSVSGKVMLFFRKDSITQQLGYGDKLLVYTKITEVAPPQNPYQFNYKEYLQRKGIYYQAYISLDQYRVTQPASEVSIFSIAYSLRIKMINLIKRSGLSPKEQGIASALLLGWDEDIDEETHQSFSNAGIAHFLSISGLHLGIIFMFIGYMFFWMGNSRRNRLIRGFVQLVVLWFFAVITGLSPSILRAATMFSLITVGEMFFTRASFYNNLASSAFILLLFRPLLLFDVGFQLSYLGVIGIVVLQPRIKELINVPTNLKLAQTLQNSWNQGFATSAFGKMLSKAIQGIVNAALWLVQKVWELTCVSVAAQLATLPLTFYYFHQFPVYFLIANVTVIPFAGFLLATVIFVVAFSWIPFVGGWIVKLLSLEITAITSVTSFVEKLPNATIKDFYFDKSMAVLTALFILCYAFAFVKRRKWALFTAMGFSAVFLVYVGWVSYQKEGQHKWIAYSTRNHLVMEFLDGNTSYFLSDTSVVANPKLVEFSTQGYQRNNMTSNRINLSFHEKYVDSLFFVDESFAAFGNKRFAFVTPNNCKTKSSFLPTVDYVVLSGGPKLKDVGELTQRFHFKQLVIGPDNSRYKSLRWQSQADSLGIPCHNIVTDGALEVIEN